MSGKTLSNGTLSLRFMQNASRIKQMKEVELERAELADDGKWEVNQAVKDGWGLLSSTVNRTTDVHEASYLPFLFSERSSEHSDSEQDPPAGRKIFSGRRTFNKGEETILKATEPTTEDPEAIPASTSSTSKPGRTLGLPRQIIARTSDKLSGFEEMKSSTQSARQAIFENGGVGVDLKRERAAKPQLPKSISGGFIKPGGVDDPKDLRKDSSKSKKAKRVREPSPADDAFSGRRKQKKSKRISGSE